MKDSNQEITLDPIKNARRYVTNARDALRDHGKLNTDTGRYEDPKYVKAAGHYLWSGVLIALDFVFHVKEEKKKQKRDSRVSVDDYIAVIAKRDYKLLGWVKDGYELLHLSMGYDGIQNKKVCENGFELANSIIDRCEGMMGK